eukprot:Anaeramoba_ignava/a89913_64.p3 GENE.a89913_64~~a89913_64.p3  ORF type:complete len:248 (-),score=86.15 a89913_64:3423-4166(-)
MLQKMEKRLFFISNNALSRRMYCEKMRERGFDVSVEQMISSGFTASQYFKQNKIDNILCLSGPGVPEELKNQGISFRRAEEFVNQPFDINKIEIDPKIQAVLLAKADYYTYYDIAVISLYLSNPKVLFFATNNDPTFPIGSRFIPGCGSMVSAVEFATQRKATILGKPQIHGFTQLKQRHPEIQKEETLMIGDRLDTDIQFGNSCGIQTICLLSGVTSEEEIIQCKNPELIPTYYTETIKDFLDEKN